MDEAFIQLRKSAEERYKLFSEVLAKSKYELIGVRLPIIRKIANLCMKKLRTEDDYIGFFNTFEQYILEVSDKLLFEELMLYGIILASSNVKDDVKIKYFDVYVHYIGDWSICDSVCTSLKIKSNGKFFGYIKSLINSREEFVLRFVIVTFMTHFMQEKYLNEIIELIEGIDVDYYYTNMAIAWWMSNLYIYNKDKFFEIFERRNLNKFVLNMSIRKIIESNRVSKEDKEQLKLLRKMKGSNHE